MVYEKITACSLFNVCRFLCNLFDNFDNLNKFRFNVVRGSSGCSWDAVLLVFGANIFARVCISVMEYVKFFRQITDDVIYYIPATRASFLHCVASHFLQLPEVSRITSKISIKSGEIIKIIASCTFMFNALIIFISIFITLLNFYIFLNFILFFLGFTFLSFYQFISQQILV